MSLQPNVLVVAGLAREARIATGPGVEAIQAGGSPQRLRVLLDAGWALEALRLLDLYPMTEHVELVATLSPPLFSVVPPL